MTRRDHIIQTLGMLVGAILAGILASQGVRVPPLPLPQPPAPVQPQPPAPVLPDLGAIPMPQPPVPRADPMGARLKLRTSIGGCTAAVVGPQRADGRYWVASAAHCVSKIGDTATGTLPTGESVTLTVQAIDRKSDCSWLLSSATNHSLPFAILAKSSPPPGRRVWVAGYGQHAPGVQRFGVVVGGPTPDGQIQYKIAVSPGDSGGPIVDDETGELLGTVCCTAAFGKDASVFGAGPVALEAHRPRMVLLDGEWNPVPLPIR